jgi:hypothetical protein
MLRVGPYIESMLLKKSLQKLFATASVINRHSPDELWNVVNDSRRRGSQEAGRGLGPEIIKLDKSARGV